MMKTLTGRPVSPGYAKGTAVVYNSAAILEIPRYEIDEDRVDTEIHRFHKALERTKAELKQLEQHVLSNLGKNFSTIFSAHLAFLQDRQFTQQVEQRVRSDLINVEQALNLQIEDLAHLFESLENEYLRERSQDIRDLGQRLMHQLVREEVQRYVRLAPRSVIVARELLPSETIDLDCKQVVGIVTEHGGENSHAAILARALGIPAVTAVSSATSRIAPDSQILVDGNVGHVTVSPTDAAAEDLTTQKSNYDDASAAAVDAERLECVTVDGTRVSLLANLNRVEEVESVESHCLDGVGLFRTEFLYMDSPEAPTFERHLDTYQRLLDRLDGRRCVVRTLDLGGDKLPRFLIPHHETNPSLGARGLRFSLSQQKFFTAQLRALLMAGRDQELCILFPMVLGESDLAEARQQVERLVDELNLSKAPCLGAMIETPSALFSLREIVQQVDFVSIGTNDLTQFMLAADRDAENLIDDYSVLHPSVLRAIHQVVKVCEETGCEISVCGEAAGDVDTARLLVGLGIRQLSMSSVRAARVRVGIRSVRHCDLAELAQRALHADSAASVRGLLRQLRSDTTGGVMGMR